MRYIVAGVAVWAAGAACLGQVTAETPGWFAFDVPALDVPADAIVDLSPLNPEPAGAQGFVRVDQGHFTHAGGQPLRLFGTNVTGDSCFPDRETATRLAVRLRQYGLNCLRLHFMDFSWGTDTRDSLWQDPAKGTLSEANLAKLDWLMAECARNGIYLNLNLHVGRQYPGSPEPAGARAFRFSKSLDRWYEPYVQQMEAFCRALLGHVNPHTGRRYADEPAIACVEMNNENTLITREALRDYRLLPEPFQGAFVERWTAWLRETYGTDEALRAAWDRDVEPLGDDLLREPGAWVVQNGGEAQSTLTGADGRLIWEATRAGSQGWHLQLQYKGLAAAPGRYTLTFRARSREPLAVRHTLMLDTDPWGTVGLAGTVALTPAWQTVTVCGPVVAPGVPGPLRLNLSLENQPGQIEIEQISLRPGGGEGLRPGDSLDGRVGLPGDAAVPAVQRDWTRCLIDTEMATTRRLATLLRTELGCRMPVADTQVSYGGIAGLLRETTLSDYIDIHGYWQHPSYTYAPGTNRTIGFRIANSSQVADPAGGTLATMALQRPEGWPFSISEYNTPAPNDHGAEIFPLFAAIASLQDWDAFYSYTYRDFGKDYENTFIKRYFHFIGRAATLVHLPASALAFRNRWIQPAAQRVVCALPRSQVAELTATYGDLPGLWRALQADPGLAWTRATAVRLVDGDLPPRLSGDTSLAAGARRSDTEQIRWDPRDPTGPWFILNAPAVRFLIGHVGGRTFEVGDVRLDVAARPWPRPLPAYACISLVALDGLPVRDSRRLLLAASARTENSGMAWNPDRTTLVGDGWGKPPTLSEAVPLTLTLPWERLEAAALGPDGRVTGSLPATGGQLTLGPDVRTLWVLLTR